MTHMIFDAAAGSSFGPAFAPSAAAGFIVRVMLANLERARHPASSLSRPSRRGRDRCERSESRRGLQPRRPALRRGSECRKSLQAPGFGCDRARGRGSENIFEQISSGGTVTYLHHDQAGSTRLITGSTGTVEGAYTYDAYGNTTGHTGTATTPFGYDGQYASTDTGLIYMRNRIYDPATAQFLTVDPLEIVTRAPYGYGEENPLNRDDATGLSSWNPFSESFWTEGNFISESPLNPIPYYEAEIESYENGCGYFASVAHGLEGAVAGTALFAGGEGEDEAGGGVGIAENSASHIFRDAPGHLAEDTRENRALIEGAVNQGNYVDTHEPGVSVYRETLPNGTQVWAEVYNGEITNGGLNATPR
jgi:RHS repeat-associated protein